MWRSIIVVAALCVAAPARAELAYSQQVVDQTCDFLEWALDLQMTAGQRDHAKTLLADLWKKKDHKAIGTIEEILEARAKLVGLQPDARAKAQVQVQTAMLDALHKGTQDAASKWLLAVYDSAHTSLVTGDPPLTRQSVDALAELLGFLYGEAGNGKPIAIDAKYEDSLASGLVEHWRDLPEATRRSLGQVPAYWAAIRVQWAAMPEGDRKKLRAQWAKSLAPPKAAGKSPQSLAMQIYAEKTRHELAMHAIDAIGCAAGGCTWKYEYRWVP
jgi:hypothetical protein